MDRSFRPSHSLSSSKTNRPDSVEIIELLNMSEYTHHLQTRVALDKPLFDATPKWIDVKDYEPFCNLEYTITLQNQDYVPRRVKIANPESSFFKISAPKFDSKGRSGNDKVAPGASVSYILTFMPQAQVDYQLDLVVITEREKYKIPVRVTGCRATLSFPGEIIYPKTPVRFNATRPVLLSNIAGKSTRFRVSVDSPFKVSPSDGFLNVGEHCQLVVSFEPPSEGNFEGDLVIEDEDGQYFMCRLFGTSEAVDVHLECTDIILPPTYVGLVSQQTVRIVNNSPVPINYSWKINATASQDHAFYDEMLRLYDKDERTELEALDDVQSSAYLTEENDIEEDDDEETIRLKRMHLITRKYRVLRAELKENLLLYSSNDFAVSPISGEIWPSGYMDVNVFYKPQHAIPSMSTAFCEVVGRVARLPVYMKGSGLGPKASFTYDSLDIGEVYVHGVYKYNIQLQNIGEIDATFELLDNSAEDIPFESRFAFSPTSGSLSPGDTQNFEIIFSCGILGPFSEIIEWRIHGRLEPLVLTFKGNVVGPKISFDVPEVDFGLASYGFVQSKTIIFSNNSDIPIKYFLSIPEDGKYYAKEFGISPATGTMMPKSTVPVTLEFLPSQLKMYQYSLVVEIDGIGNQPLKIPLKAECIVPVLSIPIPSVEFHDCYIGYSYEGSFDIFNSSILPGKYEVIMSEESCHHAGVHLIFEKPQGSIPAKTTYSVPFSMKIVKVGPVFLNLQVRTGGNEASPLAVQINGNGIGPTLRIEPSSLAFDISVLTLSSQPLKVFNDSPIPANVKAFAAKKGSGFFIDPCEILIAPNSEFEFKACVFLDEVLKQSDSYYIMPDDGVHAIIPVEAVGTGSTIVSEDKIELVELGPVFTAASTTKQIKLENRGRRAQLITWEFSKKLSESLEGSTKSSCFRVYPDKINMPPFTSMIFTIEASSTESGVVSELWNCKSLLAGNKVSSVALASTFKCDFIVPLLSFNPSITNDGIGFEYTYVQGKHIMPQIKTVKMKNVSKLKLVFMMRVAAPFSLDSLEYELNPGQETDLVIQFDPGMKTDRVSATINQQIQITYRDHTQKDRINLIAQVAFPNLEFEKTTVDFGCILNETLTRTVVRMKNPSLVPTNYSWSFIEEVSSLQSPMPYNVPINEVFDINPISGVLLPNEFVDVHFIFYGHADSKFSTIAACNVVGGPEYELNLIGEAGSVGFRVEPSEIIFPEQNFSLITTQDIFVYNTSRVSFRFNINSAELNSVYTLSHSNGIIKPNDKVKLTVTFNPRIPSFFSGNFSIQAAYFDPVIIKVTGRSSFPQISLSIPRSDEDSPSWLNCVNLAQSMQKTTSQNFSSTIAALPTNSLVEIEAERISFSDKVASVIPPKEGKFDYTSLNVSEFSCNLGYIIRGASKKKQFKITNVHSFPISLEFPVKAFSKCPSFTIEPMKITSLPSGGSVECTVSFASTKSSDLKVNDLDIPILIKDGPSYSLKLRASVTIPIMEISSVSVDFGLVLSGYCKIIKLVLKNKEPVPCEWSQGKLVANHSGDEVTHFTCSPDSGVLAPGETSELVITYRPLNVHAEAGCKLPIRVASNPRATNITLLGRSSDLALRFDPPLVLSGNIIPGNEKCSTLNMCNDSDVPIEVYSTDVDDSYLSEENMLRSLAWNSNGEILDAPRIPGQPFPKSLLEKCQIAADKLELEMLGEVSTVGNSKIVVVLCVNEDYCNHISQSVASHGSRAVSLNQMLDYFSDEVGKSSEPEFGSLKTDISSDKAIKLISRLFVTYLSFPAHRILTLNGMIINGIICGAVSLVNCLAGLLDGIAEINKKRSSDIPIHFLKLKCDLQHALNKLDLERRELSETLADVTKKIDPKTWPALLKGFNVLAVDDLAKFSADELAKYQDLESKHNLMQQKVSLAERLEKVPTDASIQSIYGLFDEALDKINEFYPSIVDLTDVRAPNSSKCLNDDSILPEIFVPKVCFSNIVVVADSIVNSEETALATLAVGDFYRSRHQDIDLFQIYHKPIVRSKKNSHSSFQMTTPNQSNDSMTRWVIPAKSFIPVVIKYNSSTVGKHDAIFSFEIVGKWSFVNNKPHMYSFSCSGKCAYPEIASDPRQVFMNRVKNKRAGVIVKKQFIVDSNVFEFGPLLIGKDSNSRKDKATLKIYSENFRITNTGLFPAKVDFKLKGLPVDPDKKVSSKEVFYFEPSNMELAPDEVKEISVFAFPSVLGTFEDALICSVEQNPNPVIFPLRCEGSKPIVEVSCANITFDRLLIGQSESKTFVISNKSSVPTNWNIEEELRMDEILLEPASGVLKAFSHCEVTVRFTSIKQKEILSKILINYHDVEGWMGKVGSHALTIAAEAFEVDYKIDLPPHGLDFGTLIVGDEKKMEFNLKNAGKYDIKFSSLQTNKGTKKDSLSEFFNFTPHEGQLKPNQDSKFCVTFNCNREVLLKSNADFKIQIFEEKTNKLIVAIPVRISVASVFSKFRMLPNQGISFGPLEIDSSRIKKFEIINDGEFDFELKIVPAFLTEEKDEKSKDDNKKKDDKKKEAPKKADPPQKQADVVLGPFAISPSSFIVPTKGKMTVEVLLSGKIPGLFSETIELLISNRDPLKDAHVLYELNGECCSPGIETSDFDSIFEEQIVVRSTENKSDINSKRNMYLVDENVFSFCPVISGDSAPVVNERFKIINPFKVPCNVKFESKSKNLDPKSIDDSSCFKIEPLALHIPAHEYRFVTASFKPKEMKLVSSVFSAIVDKGTDPKTKSLAFELRGEGTLPHFTVTKPSIRDESGKYVMSFPRLFLGKSSNLPISIRNDGAISTAIRLELDSDVFKYLGKSTILLDPGQVFSIEVAYRPKSVGLHSSELVFRVANNPFEDTIFKLAGESYQDDITMEGLVEDEIVFGDMSIGQKVESTFNLVNHSNSNYKYEWDSYPGVSITPCIGHIPPMVTKQFTCNFESGVSVSLKKELINCKFMKIKLDEAVENDNMWDNSSKEIIYMTDIQYDSWRDYQDQTVAHEKKKAAAIEALKLNPKAKVDKVEDLNPWVMPIVAENGEDKLEPRAISKPEPKFSSLSEYKTLCGLKLSATVDNPTYSFDLPKSVLFRPTMMFQSRVFKFNFKNTGKTTLKYNWETSLIEPVIFSSPLLPISSENPFLITPSNGAIAPNQEETFTINFTPWDAVDFKSVLSAFIGSDAIDTPKFELVGTGLRPKAHIELLNSDYLSSARRPAEMRNPDGTLGLLDPSVYRVIELQSLGTKIRNTKRFYVLNPTNESYLFEWSCQDNSSGPFKCLTMKGIILSGKRYEMVFEYLAEDIGIFESFWKFSIPDANIVVPFLMVGTVAEPDVYLEKSHINFNSLLVASKLTETVVIVNKEHIPFAFSLDGSSYQSDQSFDVEPKSGVVPANSSFPLSVTFTPTEDKSYNTNIHLKIKNKTGKVMLNLKGEGYTIKELVQVEESSGLNVNVVSNKVYKLDFGSVQVHDRQIKNITIFNNGKYNFDFAWNYSKSQKLVEITPESGSVKKGSSIQCSASFLTNKVASLDQLKASLTIGGGSKQYPFSISGSGHVPKLEFSSTALDFGPQFVGAKSSTIMLQVVNKETHKNVTIEAVFENKPHLEVRGAASVLAPRESAEFMVIFTAREYSAFKDVISFEINGVYNIPVVVTGEGVPLRLEFSDPTEQNIAFGNLRVGNVATKFVRIVNQSKKAVQLSLLNNPKLTKYITFAPDLLQPKTHEIRPRQGMDLSVRFAPLERLPLFSEEVKIEVEEIVRPLLRVTGACLGVGLALDSENLPFGPVILHSHLEKRLMLENHGDVPCKFRFDTSKFSPDFTIKPFEGTVLPQDALALDIRFEPKSLNNDIRYSRLPCYVDGSETLYVTLTGSCVPASDDEAKEIKFESKVRKSISRNIVIENPTSVRWTLTPNISHDAWSCPKTVDVPSNGKTEYTIHYAPSKMTINDSVDRADLFFALPTGSALVFKLVGVATIPDPEDSLEIDTPSKKTFVKSLMVKNWMQKSQRFKTVIDIEENDPSVSIKGAASIEVPGLLEREFKLSFYAFKEGVTHSNIKFVNETTGEFIFYRIIWKASKAGVLLNYTLESAIRQKVTTLIPIQNPLNSIVELSKFECENPDVFVVTPVTIQPNSDCNVEICFRPLTKCNHLVTNMVLFSPQLGEFRYSLDLSCNTLSNERTLRFDAYLGEDILQKFRFTSFETSAGEFECKIGGSEFTCEPKVKILGCNRGSDGEELIVDVKYEPTSLGDVRDMLVLKRGNSEYKVPLYGHCQPPKPQGPLLLKTNGSITIPFKNVFANAEEFSYSVDNSSFVLAKKSEKIDGKKSVQISVSFKPDSSKGDKSKPVLGKMYITCPNLPPFVYYLKGDW